MDINVEVYYKKGSRCDWYLYTDAYLLVHEPNDKKAYLQIRRCTDNELLLSKFVDDYSVINRPDGIFVEYTEDDE